MLIWAIFERFDRTFVSLATTSNPFPEAPARSTPMLEFKATRLVSSARNLICLRTKFIYQFQWRSWQLTDWCHRWYLHNSAYHSSSTYFWKYLKIGYGLGYRCPCTWSLIRDFHNSTWNLAKTFTCIATLYSLNCNFESGEVCLLCLFCNSVGRALYFDNFCNAILHLGWTYSVPGYNILRF